MIHLKTIFSYWASKQAGRQSSLQSIAQALGWPLSVESENINDPVFAINALADMMRKQ
jgi:hypothetical protein